jgi:hypothetical protein
MLEAGHNLLLGSGVVVLGIVWVHAEYAIHFLII